MRNYLEINHMQIYFALLLKALNVPLRIGKCTPVGTGTPGWEPLLWEDELPFLREIQLTDTRMVLQS